MAAVLDMVETPDTETSVQAAEILNRAETRTPTKGKDSDKRDRTTTATSTPEVSLWNQKDIYNKYSMGDYID